MMRRAILASLLLLVSCGKEATKLEDFNTTAITLPGGQKIRAETLTNPTDMIRGMMFRDSLAHDRGMLFIHGSAGKFPYWMHQVRIPLDIIWLDGSKRIVEIVSHAPPCKTESKDCPTYGGKQTAVFVLELAGGQAQRYGLKVGDRVVF